MKSEQILKTDLLDILFENRNKAYGAYSIRKAYPSHLKKAMATMLLLVGTASIIVMSKPKKADTYARLPYDTLEVNLEKIEIEKPKEPETQQRTVEAQPPTRVDKPIVIVPDETPIENEPIDRTDTTIYVPGNENRAAVGTGGEGFMQANAGNQTIISPEPPQTPEPAQPVIVEHPDEYPEFPGGMQAWAKYLQRMLRVPDDLESGDRKTVRVKFVVNMNGEVTDVVISQSAGKELDKEVLRVIGRMPKWKPGKQRGKPVASYFTQPVTFTAPEE